MAGWHSLSGYLYCKPTGAFSRFKAKKKQWYIFEESRSQLLFYRSQTEAKSTEPLGAINIKNATISLNLEEQNQFVINTEGKEYAFQAENHESMMIWLIGLQAKREASINKEYRNADIMSPKKLTRRSKTFDLSDTHTVGSFMRRKRVSEPVVHSVPVINSAGFRDDYAWSRSSSCRTHRTIMGNGGLDSSDTVPRIDRRGRLATLSATDTLSMVADSAFAIEEEEDADEELLTSHPEPATVEDFNTMRRSSTFADQDELDNQTSSRDPSLSLSHSFSCSSNGALRKRFRDLKVSLSQSFTTGLSKVPHVREIEEEDEDAANATLQHSHSARQLRSHTTSESDGDEVFNYEALLEHGAAASNVMSKSATYMSTGCESQSTSMDSGIINKEDRNESLSDDSAIDKENDLQNKNKTLEDELLKTKTELSRTKNKATCLKELLEKREVTISALDEKVSRLEQLEKALTQKDKADDDTAVSTISPRQKRNILRTRPSLPCFPEENESSVTDALSRTTDTLKRTEERCRVFQNQNRFLNEEVKKLTNMRNTDHVKLRDLHSQIQELELEIERWKRDYVFLLQSNITVPTGDVTDGFELNLYGGNRHRERLKELLEEARLKNPGLPTFEKLNQAGHHVDRYGFKHTHDNESLLLHYICRQMHEHYESQLARHEEHQLAWRAYLKQNRNKLQRTKELKTLCRRGIPAQYRNEVWRMLIYDEVKDIIHVRGQHYYNSLINQIPESETAGAHRKQISLDLLRTLPTNIHFDQNDADGIKKLQEVLQAFTIHNPNIGYCQGMNFIAGMALLFLDKEDAFWCLVGMTERYFPPYYFDLNLIGAQADQLVLKQLVEEKLPVLHEHLQNIDIDIATITLNWFLAVYFDAVPFETLVRIWDCFLLEGPKVLFRFALAILQIHERILLQQKDTISVWKHLKLAAKLTFDVEGFIKVAFEEMKPFPRRKDILAKQACYSNAFKEYEKNKEMKRRHYQDTEEKLRQLDRMSYHRPLIECITAYDNGKLWVCYGEQNSARICMINCEDSLMYDLSCEFDSRIMCAAGLSPEIVLLGSLSMNLYAFSTETKEKIWQTRLHDSIMGLCIAFGEDRKQNKVFAALADGTIAVIENVSIHEPMGNIFYIPIGYSPVTSMLLVNQELWCACSNTVQILNSSTLDQKVSFDISNNPLDHILCLRQGMHGIWIAVKGSSIVELWDEHSLTCKLLYDVKENKYVRTKREDEAYFNPQRVTSLLPFNNTVWVGTGNGDLGVYEITCKTGYLSRSNSLRTCRASAESWGRKFSIEEKVSKYFHSAKRTVSEDDDATPTTSPTHAAATNQSGGTGVRPESISRTTENQSQSAPKPIQRMSRMTQTPGQLLQRHIVINKRRRSSENSGRLSDEEITQSSDGARIFEMSLNDEVVRKASDGVHLEIFLQMNNDIENNKETIPVIENWSPIREKLQTDDKCVCTEELGDIQNDHQESADIEIDDSQIDNDDSAIDPTSEEHNSTVSNLSIPPASGKEEGKLTPIMEDAERSSSISGESVIDMNSRSAANHSRAPSESAVSTPSICHDERTSECFSSCEETTFSENPRPAEQKLPPQMSSSTSKTSDQFTPDAEGLYDHELVLLVKNKIAESPIRCLVQTVSEDEPIIISCTSRFEEDEAVLKWKRASYENKIWTNEPVFQVCQQTQTVQLPAYMKHRLSMSSKGSSDDR